jgi:hypothetical protein
MAAPHVSKTGIVYPDNYTPQTEEVQKLIIEEWNKSYPNNPFHNFTDITNEWVLGKVGVGLSMEEAMENVFSRLAQGISDSTGFEPDSMKALLQGAFLDIHYDKTVKNPVLTKNEVDKTKFEGTLSAMENSRKQFEMVQTKDIIRKQEEFSRIKSLYDLADDASMDDAFSRLLEDLTPGELKSINTTGTLPEDEAGKGRYFKKIYDEAGKEIDKVALGLDKMLPVPLATSEWVDKGPRALVYGGMAGPQYGVQNVIHSDVKFTEESFEEYLYREKRQELVDLAKVAGRKIDHKIINESSRSYAEDRAEKGFKIYQDYQREALKDLNTEDIMGAISRLESAKEYDAQLKGMFTD